MTNFKPLRALTLIGGGFFCLSIPGTAKDDNPGATLRPKEKLHLYLLAGQSNMAGRGEITEADKKIHPNIFMFTKEGQWAHAVAPIHYDKKSAGVGLAKSFAQILAKEDKEVAICLIPAACGGSPISTWKPGGFHGQTKSHPYDDAIKRAKQAMQVGVLKGILWHQGESDSNPTRAPHYEKALRELIQRFRKDLNAPEVPFIIGQLGQFPSRPWNDARKQINAAHVRIATSTPFVGFVSSHDLTPMKDQIHFNAESLREFGRRYADTYLRVVK